MIWGLSFFAHAYSLFDVCTVLSVLLTICADKVFLKGLLVGVLELEMLEILKKETTKLSHTS